MEELPKMQLKPPLQGSGQQLGTSSEFKQKKKKKFKKAVEEQCTEHLLYFHSTDQSCLQFSQRYVTDLFIKIAI